MKCIYSVVNCWKNNMTHAPNKALIERKVKIELNKQFVKQ